MHVWANENIVQEILFKADFNHGSDIQRLGFEFSGNKTAKIVSEEILGNSPALEISLNRFDDEISYRSEIVPRNLPSTDFVNTIHAIIGHEYWYSFRILFPMDWEFDKSREIVVQWHGRPDFELGENWRNPPLSLIIGEGNFGIGRNYLLVVMADSKELTSDNGQENIYTFQKEFDLGPLAFDLGKWTQWVFHIKWSYKNDGFITVWKDGEKVFNFDRLSNCFNDGLGPYWKLGIYKWDWKDPSFKSCIEKRILYYDDICIGNKNATYDAISTMQNTGQ